MPFKALILIPVFNNAATIRRVVEESMAFGPVLVVNDGSNDGSGTEADKTGAEVLHLESNEGKGGALQQGFNWARQRDYSHVVVLDGDGQHYPHEIPKMMKVAEEHPGALVVGHRDFQANVPGASIFGRAFCNLWIRLETGQRVSDSQSGFRVYPLKPLEGLNFLCTRYDFEVEVMVKLFWKATPLIDVPISVFYPPAEERVSHFKKGKDNLRISWLHTRLITHKIIQYLLNPWQTLKKVHGEAMAAIQKNSQPKALAWSVFMGVMVGVSPFYGLQILITVALAYRFRLNVPLSLLAAHISIPPFIPVIIYSCLQLGSLLLTGHAFVTENAFDPTLAREFFGAWLMGSVVLGVLLGVPLALGTYVWADRRQRNAPLAWNGKTKGGQWGYAFFFAALKSFGRKPCYFLLYGVALFYFCFEQRSRCVGRAFLDRVRPSASPWERWTFPYRQFMALGKIIIDRMYYLSTGTCPPNESYNNQTIADIDSQSEGGLVISGHFGGWELAAKVAPDWYQPQINILMHNAEEEQMKAFLSKIQGKGDRRVHVIAASDGFSAYLDIYKALKNKELVTMHADRSMSGRVFSLPFFGQAANFPEDPFMLAAKLNCALIVAFTHRRQDGSYFFEGHKIGPMSESTIKGKELALEYAQQYIQLFEQRLKQQPEQWFNFYDFWNQDVAS